MNSKLFFLSFCQLLILQITNAECETEQDLDFQSCDLIHLSDEALNDICHRIGLDLKSHVLPTLLGMDEDGEVGVGEVKERAYTHEDYVRGAEECLMIEDEVSYFYKLKLYCVSHSNPVLYISTKILITHSFHLIRFFS